MGPLQNSMDLDGFTCNHSCSSLITMMSESERGPFYWDHDGREAAFVERLRALRESNGWSQSELARRAQEAGLSFHQPTVQRIESGERPLKLSEALTLSTLFGIQLESSLGDPRNATLLHAVLRAEKDRDALHAAALSFLAAQDTVGVYWLAGGAAALSDLDRARVDSVLDEDAIGEAVRQAVQSFDSSREIADRDGANDA